MGLRDTCLVHVRPALPENSSWDEILPRIFDARDVDVGLTDAVRNLSAKLVGIVPGYLPGLEALAFDGCLADAVLDTFDCIIACPRSHLRSGE